MDPTTSNPNQAGIIALLQQLGLGQFANGAPSSMGPGLDNSGQTVGGQPASFDSGTINVNNAGGQGGFTDQQLMGNALPPGFAVSANSSQGGGYGNAGNNFGVGVPGRPLSWYPTSDKAASDFAAAQGTFDQNQANEIQKLLSSLGNTPAATTPNLANSLSNASPNQGSTVTSGQGIYTPPAQARIPGLGSPPPSAPVSTPVVPPAISAPTGPIASPGLQPVTPQTTIPANNPSFVSQLIKQQGGPLQASAGTGIQSGSLPPSAPVAPMSTNTDTGGPSNVAPAQTQDPGLRLYKPSATPLTTPSSSSTSQSAYTPPAYAGTWQAAAGEANDPDPDPSAATAANYAAGGAQDGTAGGLTGAQAGSSIGSAITAIGNALKPVNIPYTGPSSSVLNAAYFRPTQFMPPVVRAQPQT